MSKLLAAGTAPTLHLDEYPTIWFSAKNLRSSRYNPRSNASKYRAPNHLPQVQLRCRRTTPSQVVFEVQDNDLRLSE